MLVRKSFLDDYYDNFSFFETALDCSYQIIQATYKACTQNPAVFVSTVILLSAPIVASFEPVIKEQIPVNTVNNYEAYALNHVSPDIYFAQNNYEIVHTNAPFLHQVQFFVFENLLDNQDIYPFFKTVNELAVANDVVLIRSESATGRIPCETFCATTSSELKLNCKDDSKSISLSLNAAFSCNFWNYNSALEAASTKNIVDMAYAQKSLNDLSRYKQEIENAKADHMSALANNSMDSGDEKRRFQQAYNLLNTFVTTLYNRNIDYRKHFERERTYLSIPKLSITNTITAIPNKFDTLLGIVNRVKRSLETIYEAQHRISQNKTATVETEINKAAVKAFTDYRNKPARKFGIFSSSVVHSSNFERALAKTTFVVLRRKTSLSNG